MQIEEGHAIRDTIMDGWSGRPEPEPELGCGQYIQGNKQRVMTMTNNFGYLQL